MRRFALLFALATLILLIACGGGSRDPVERDVSGHWNLLLSSADQTAPITLGGYLSVSNGSINGTLHAFKTECIAPDTDIPFTSTIAGSATTMKSASIDGQVITLTMPGREPYWGTFRVDGGCADGLHGDLLGFPVQGSLTGGYRAHFGGQEEARTATLTQATAPDIHGVYPVTGTMDMTGSLCSVSGTIESGFVAGWNVVLHITTVENDGSTANVRFVGDAFSSTTTLVSGTYTYESGACAGTSSTLSFVR